jgi:hypothetical protein
MNEAIPNGIWPPREILDLEPMLFCTRTAMIAAEAMRAALDAVTRYDPDSKEWQGCAQVIVNGAQTIALQAAALSRYCWPVRGKEPHAARATRLRGGLGVSDASALKNRDLRNHLEHFDERLDEFCQGLRAGVILPTYVGPLRDEEGLPILLFRAYYTDVAVFEVFGNRYSIQPLLDEIHVLHGKLGACVRSGGRLPYTSGSDL